MYLHIDLCMCVCVYVRKLHWDRDSDRGKLGCGFLSPLP